MPFNQFEMLLIQLQRQTKIDFDKEKKVFRLTMPISPVNASPSVCSYVNKRKELSFKPHQTSFHLASFNQVRLIQEIPFHAGCQQTLRSQLVEFWHLGKRCCQMLLEIAAEEHLEFLTLK